MPLPPPPLQINPAKVEEDGDLYLAVLPLVHYSRLFSGAQFEEVMTLVPDRNFATEFRSDVAALYVQTFREAAEEKYGGPIRKFNYTAYDAGEGKCYIVVTPYGT
jgi:hypothetical protein